MRSQAIEKLATRLVREVLDNEGHLTTHATIYARKMEILTDRFNGDKAAAVIREVMNS